MIYRSFFLFGLYLKYKDGREKDRIMTDENDILKMLEQIPIFAGIGIHEQHLVARRCHIRKVPEDTIVIEQDDISDFLYLIVDGVVTISKKTPSSGWVRVNILNKGDFFGEIAILRNIRRTARVTTKTACTFITLSGEDFLQVYQLFPRQARDNIQLVVAKRLAQLASS